MHNVRLRARLLSALAVVGCAVLLIPAASSAAPGNNGTIKIDGVPWDQHPNNEPHPGCIFQVDFYNYDEGDLNADVRFAAQPPSGSRYTTLLTDSVFIGEDPAGGGTDVDAQEAYDLSTALTSLYEHPNQGYHVKLTVHAEGSKGRDTKYKTFWIPGCNIGSSG